MRNTQIAGFRRITEGLLASQQLASEPLSTSVDKNALSLTLKRAATALRITGSAYQVLDILLALTQPQDFNAGSRPIVAISNNKLAEYVNRSTRTVSRLIKSLVEAGILAYSDSSTGRRGVTRDSGGEIKQAYGLDFTPACSRLAELRKIADDFKLKVESENRAKRIISARKRSICDIATFIGDAAMPLVEELKEVLGSPLSLLECEAEVNSIYLRILNLNDKMSLQGDKNDAPYYNTIPTQTEKVIEKRCELNCSPSILCSDNAKRVESAFEKKQLTKLEPKKTTYRDQTNQLSGVSIGLLSSASSCVYNDLGIKFRTWPELQKYSKELCLAVGLSSSAWDEYVDRHGKLLCSACLLTVVEKTLRNPEVINRPAGYFRAMLDRASEGKLHLAKSLFGLVGN